MLAARAVLTIGRDGSIVANRAAMNIVKATHRFEEWLGRHTPLVKPDLRLKHKQMADAVFPFFRATFYRWMQVWPEVCADLAKAPQVLAVGDLHVENFGTWRDIEGRLVWGINDFDEAAVLPYTIDLVRLAASAMVAITVGPSDVEAERRLRVDSGRLPEISRTPRSSLRARRGPRLVAPDRDRSIARSSPFLAQDGPACHLCDVRFPSARRKPLSTSCQSTDLPTARSGASLAWEASDTFAWSPSRNVTAPTSRAKPRRWFHLRFTGSMETRIRWRSCTKPSSAAQYAAPILLCACTGTGSSAACLHIVRASK